MLKVAQKYVGSMSIRYTGVDSFDARSEAECKLPLIQIHRELQKVDAKTQLVPGDIASSHSPHCELACSHGFDCNFCGLRSGSLGK